VYDEDDVGTSLTLPESESYVVVPDVDDNRSDDNSHGVHVPTEDQEDLDAIGRVVSYDTYENPTAEELAGMEIPQDASSTESAQVSVYIHMIRSTTTSESPVVVSDLSTRMQVTKRVRVRIPLNSTASSTVVSNKSSAVRQEKGLMAMSSSRYFYAATILN